MSLEERMKMTVKGQVTWADPGRNSGARCDACRHFARLARANAKGNGVCALVQAHTRKPGLPFFGDQAFGCSIFERRYP